MVDHDDRLQLERDGSIAVPDMPQLQLQLDRANPAVSASAAVLQLDRLQLERL